MKRGFLKGTSVLEVNVLTGAVLLLFFAGRGALKRVYIVGEYTHIDVGGPNIYRCDTPE